MALIKPQTARALVRGYGFERVRGGRSKFKAVLQKFLPKVVEVELARGFRMELDLSVDRQAYDFWHWEEDEAQLLWAINTLLPPCGTLIDCGANIGFFGIYSIYARAANVHFLEPHPRLAAQIQRSLDLNAYGVKGKIHEMAALSHAGTMNLHLKTSNSDGSHTLMAQSSSGDSVAVKTTRLDSLFAAEKIPQVDFLKIDCEGADLEVIKGLGSWLNPKTVSVLYIEENDAGLCGMLKGAGYIGYQSRRFYIDALRKKIRGGDHHSFFQPATGPGVNLLWVGQGSAHQELLDQVVQY